MTIRKNKKKLRKKRDSIESKQERKSKSNII